MRHEVADVDQAEGWRDSGDAMSDSSYVLGFIAGIGLSNCGVGGGFDLLPGRQYHVDFRFDTLARQCVITLERLDDAVAGAWKAQPFLKGEVCKSG